jgi:ISXO2-like transposase domain/Transposase zinc-ribbon domain
MSEGDEKLEGMNNFPQNLMEFEEQFATEMACVKYVRSLKWPNGFCCAACQGTKSWPLKNRRVEECADCGHQESVTAGTLFHQTRKPLRLWFRAVTLWVTSKRSMSAKELSRQLDIHYETAWHWCHRLRAAVGESFGREKLGGAVELDETSLGGSDDKASQGRSLAGKKALVIGAIEVRGKHLGRVRLEKIPRATPQNVEGFAARNIEPHAFASTRGLLRSKHSMVTRLRRRHISVEEYPSSGVLRLARIHKVFSLFRRTVLGTFHGSVSHKYLQAYLNEFEFRFNRRNAGSRWLLFFRVMQAAPLARGLSLHEIVQLMV